jgi:PHD/YefM family antitoxin component YafN of YafNO toxin-antitoxin module
MTIHPQIIKKEGKKEFVVLPYDEFIKIRDALEDYEDLKLLREEKEKSKDQSTIPLDKVIMDMDL